jgi:hypothetical protein
MQQEITKVYDDLELTLSTLSSNEEKRGPPVCSMQAENIGMVF